jgi:hypothetical protein
MALQSKKTELKHMVLKKRPLNKVDHLVERIGIGIVQTVERYYQRYIDQPNEKNAKQYVLWRLRLHRRVKNDRALLDAINDARPLGLYDERPGRLCWDLIFD